MAAVVKKDHTCSVCLELFSEPKVLPCCHTFCLKCLEKTARSGQKKGEIACPQCRKTHAIPAGGLTEFLTDFIASYEIEVTQLKSPQDAGQRGKRNGSKCGECEEEGTVETYCTDCQNYLCRGCVEAHKKFKAYRGHKVVPILELNVATLQSGQVQYCSTHKDEALKLFCETCMALVCRDCILVEHREHQYTFVKNACTKVTKQLRDLSQAVQRKVRMCTSNLAEIQKVEMTATGYSEVLKADINAFFDKMDRSLKVRRKQLLTEAETECQKDMKQIWADKVYHQMTISQITSASSLAEKALKCTSDVEMMLTSLQSIRQLTLLKETEWDNNAFITLLQTQPTFKGNLKQQVREMGIVGRLQKRGDVIVPPFPASVKLGKVSTHRVLNKKALLDFRSLQPVKLQDTKNRKVGVCVTYGQSKKKLAPENIGINDTADENSEVAIRFVCGGKHTIAVTIGGEPVPGSPFTVHVTGVPKVGSRVTEGPDWPPDQLGGRRRTQNQFGTLAPSAGLDGREVMNGVVQSVYEGMYGGTSVCPSVRGLGVGLTLGGLQLPTTVASQSTDQWGSPGDRVYSVKVYWNANHYSYNATHQWGKGCYQIELV